MRGDNMINSNDKSIIFPLGEKASGAWFTGTAHAAPIVTNDNTFNCPVYNVTFEPGSRNNWHKHPGGQILLVTGGRGFFQERGKAKQLLREGDVIKIHPNAEHWHGAAPDSRFTHIAISTNIQLGEAIWLEPVTDKEYNS
jgi:quercetin dioxygenase-like cupin family protein